MQSVLEALQEAFPDVAGAYPGAEAAPGGVQAASEQPEEGNEAALTYSSRIAAIRSKVMDRSSVP